LTPAGREDESAMFQSGRTRDEAAAKISGERDVLPSGAPESPLAAVGDRVHPFDGGGWRPIPATYDWFGALDPDGLSEEPALFEGAGEAR
jgi:hypothetical protein